MSDALITKKAIAAGLKILANKKSFNKISVSDITKECGLNRQTFYYHFQDKYELLNWIYYNEGFSVLIDGIHLYNWDKKLLELLTIMKKDQTFYTNTIKGNEQCFTEYLWNIGQTLFFEAMELLDSRNTISDEDKNFYAGFFSYGICGTILSWVFHGMKEEPAKISVKLKKLACNCESLAHRRYLDEHQNNE